MKRPSWRTLKTGDLLSIPVDDERIVIGQILIPGQVFYLCVYQPLFHIAQSVPALKDVQISLIARTTDELLWHGEWKVIGNQEIPNAFPRPYHVVSTPNGLMLRTFDDSDVRPASQQDMAIYGYKFDVSNIKFTKAMRHIHAIEECQNDFTRITFNNAQKTASLS